jgi:signal transduction histidine kinase
MAAISRTLELRDGGHERIVLLLASLAFVIVLTLAVSDSQGVAVGGLAIADLLLLALFAGALGFAGLVAWLSVSAARRAVGAANARAESYRRNLVAAEAVIRAEPQVLVFWDSTDGLKVATHTLSTVAGVPHSQPELLRFGAWLEPRSAAELKSALDSLFEDGRPFNLLLRTTAGASLEADGRATGGRALLRLREIAGYKHDIVRILDQHRHLARDIRSSRALLNAMPMPVWLASPGGRIDWVNKAYLRAVEARDDSEVRERQIELLEQRQREIIAKRLARGETFAERLHLIAGGERRAHDVTVIPLEDATVGVAIDVAALEVAQGALDRQTADFDRVVDHVSTAVATFGPDQRLAYFNKAYVEMWRLDRDWLATRPSDGEILDRLRSQSRLPPVVDYKQWKQRLTGGAPDGSASEDWWHLPDGRMLHVLTVAREDGGVAHLYEDATGRLDLESRYNELINAQRETLDSLKEGVAVFATDGRLKLHNSAFAHVWRLAPASLADRPHIDEIVRLARVLHDEPATWARISRAVTALDEGRGSAEGQMVRPDGTVIDFAAAPLPDGATLITFTDVTASKRYERALIERNEALEAADRVKSQFIGHVSYELRTPLTNIIGFSELMCNARTGALNAKQHEYLADITSSSRTLLAIIDDILDLATIDAGALELRQEVVDIRGVVDQAIGAVDERAARAGLVLDVAIADDARSLVADEERVRQILYNVLSNAIGFSHQGGRVRITAWRERGEVAFSIEDQGVGIPKEQQARIFERFESRSQGSNHRGAGLGLSIVKSLAELHGGSVRLESAPNVGTRLEIRLPEHGRAGARQRKVAQRAGA